MSGRADYTEQEWHTLLQGPPYAGMIVMMADRGGTFRETFAMGRAYAEARTHHGASQMLDEIVAAKPEIDRSHHASVDDLTSHGLTCLREARSILAAKAAPGELEEYGRFVLSVADAVSRAHKEDGAVVGPGEQQALDMISAAMDDEAAAEGPS